VIADIPAQRPSAITGREQTQQTVMILFHFLWCGGQQEDANVPQCVATATRIHKRMSRHFFVVLEHTAWVTFNTTNKQDHGTVRDVRRATIGFLIKHPRPG
jgi:hypothetical protein